MNKSKNNIPLPPLPSLQGSSKQVRRREQPPGSKNQSKKQKYKRICRETAGANLVFELAFGNIPAVVAAPVALNEDEDVDFVVYLTRHDNDDNINNKIYDTNEGDVGFGSPDLYHIRKMIELLNGDPGIETKYEAHDKEKQLKKDYIGKSSKFSYRYSLVNFLFYIYKFEKYLMNKSWIKILSIYAERLKRTVNQRSAENISGPPSWQQP